MKMSASLIASAWGREPWMEVAMVAPTGSARPALLLATTPAHHQPEGQQRGQAGAPQHQVAVQPALVDRAPPGGLLGLAAGRGDAAGPRPVHACPAGGQGRQLLLERLQLLAHLADLALQLVTLLLNRRQALLALQPAGLEAHQALVAGQLAVTGERPAE